MKLSRNATYLLALLVVAIVVVVIVVLATGGDEETTPTEEPAATAEATPEATVVATEEATVEATAEASPEATVEATVEATEEAAMEATAEVAPAETAEAASETSGEPFRIAVVMPSTGNDLAFSQSMADALRTIQQERGEDNIEIAISENLWNVDDAATAIRDYASEGYDLVIAHGSQYGSSLQEIAPDFPDTIFAWGTTVDTFDQPNIYAYEARAEQGAYVMGVMAAMLSETDVIGIVGPIDTGDAHLYVYGFEAGVKSVKPDAEVLINFTGDFSDQSKAAAAAETMLASNADVLTGTAQMVPGAVNKAKEAGKLWFGTQANQTSLAPDMVVASQVYDWTVVLDPIIDGAMEGKKGGESFAITLENGGLVIEYNPDYELPEDVKAAADETIEKIKSGELTVEVE